MNKKIILPIFLLMSAFAFSQTTVTLEDQCDCKVLTGTEVVTPGMSTPTGADLGDLYVNSDTGEIYFWDGDSWELTSSDDQQIENFSFDETTNELSLELENGGVASVNLSTLNIVETLTTIVANTDG
ncbi:hypothetical protein KO500_00670, partial [Cellulophaga baltica]|uniref:hypothetical protein n=1 Tax=Cellulophaga TaxID=104264 RepID=UPI001C07358B